MLIAPPTIVDYWTTNKAQQRDVLLPAARLMQRARRHAAAVAVRVWALVFLLMRKRLRVACGISEKGI
jgi:hypothetical protein